jgi:hypothetical protein
VKIAGFLLMLAGWILVLAAIVLLISLPSRKGFVVAGIAVEILGFVLVARVHLPPKGAKGDG